MAAFPVTGWRAEWGRAGGFGREREIWAYLGEREGSAGIRGSEAWESGDRARRAGGGQVRCGVGTGWGRGTGLGFRESSLASACEKWEGRGDLEAGRVVA